MFQIPEPGPENDQVDSMLYEKIFRELAQRKIKYMVIGGIAVNIHGYSRATGDLDIMLSFEDDNLILKI